MEGVLKKVPFTQLGDYEGEYSYLGTTLRQSNIEPQPSLSDVRRLVAEFCILPMGMVVYGHAHCKPMKSLTKIIAPYTAGLMHKKHLKHLI